MRLNGHIIPAPDLEIIRREIPGGAELIDAIERLDQDGDPAGELPGLRTVLAVMWRVVRERG